MEYIAQAWIGTSNEDAKLVKEFNSLDYAQTSGDNAYDECRKFVCEQLDTHDFGKMHFKSRERVPIDEFWFGAFTHPVRGRCTFTCQPAEFKKHLRETHEDAEEPLYSPNQIYAMTPVGVEFDVIHNLIEYTLKDSFNLEYVLYEDGWKEFEEKVEAAKRIELRYIVHVGLGSDESWELGSLWFDGKPVAVLTRQGENYEFLAYVTDQPLLHTMIEWVHSLAPRPPIGDSGIVDPDKPQEHYTEFYGHRLSDFYNAATGLPRERGKNKFGYMMTNWDHYNGVKGVE